MSIPIEVVVLGLITGMTYALLGIGLVLVYKTSRVINFAHGEMGALPAVLIPVLVVNHHWNYWPALLVSLLVAAAAGALTELVVIRKLGSGSRLILMVATIGYRSASGEMARSRRTASRQSTTRGSGTTPVSVANCRPPPR